jgi:hypothetical protein
VKACRHRVSSKVAQHGVMLARDGSPESRD